MTPGIYQHYSGRLYQVIGVARHSESLEEMVVYQALYDTYGLWVRPLKMFQEDVVIDGKTTPRFTFLHTVLQEAPKLG